MAFQFRENRRHRRTDVRQA